MKMSLLRTFAATAAGLAMSLSANAGTNPPEPEAGVTAPAVVAPPPLVANCEEGGMRRLPEPENDNSLARQFGLVVCLADGVNFAKTFPDDRTRLNKLNQLITGAQVLAQFEEMGKEMETGDLPNTGFWVARQPDGDYRYEWTTSRPASTVTSDNALPDDVRKGDNVISTLTGIIRAAAPKPKPVARSL